MTCECCGHEMSVGDFPFCPHERGANGITPDDVPGGFTVENGFDSPQTFYSRSAHEKALADRGLEIRAKWAGPHDRVMSRWVSVDLEAATRLVSRRSSVQADADHEAFPITVTDLPDTFRYKAEI